MTRIIEAILSIIIPTAHATNPVSRYPRFSPPPTGNAPIDTVNDALGIFVAVIDLAQIVFWISAAGFGLYAAYLYLFAAGNKETITKGRNMLVYTAVAIVLAIVAYGLPGIVINFIEVGSS